MSHAGTDLTFCIFKIAKYKWYDCKSTHLVHTRYALNISMHILAKNTNTKKPDMSCVNAPPQITFLYTKSCLTLQQKEEYSMRIQKETDINYNFLRHLKKIHIKGLQQ